MCGDRRIILEWIYIKMWYVGVNSECDPVKFLYVDSNEFWNFLEVEILTSPTNMSSSRILLYEVPR